jgi:hypothetical protein
VVKVGAGLVGAAVVGLGEVVPLGRADGGVGTPQLTRSVAAKIIPATDGTRAAQWFVRMVHLPP